MQNKEDIIFEREKRREAKKALARQKKLQFVRSAILAVFIVLFIRIGYIKQVLGEDYERRAMAKQVTRTEEKIINPNRGGILDRNGQSIAVSTTVYNVFLDIRILVTKPEAVRNAVIVGLNESLGIPMSTLSDYLQVTTEIDPATGQEITKPVIDRNYFVIERGISKDKADEITNKKLSCVYMERDTKRSYPLNQLAAPVIGFIRDTHWGLERQYNTEMSGEPGRVFRLYDDNLNIVDKEIPTKEGNTIVTTIDVTLQQYAEEAVLKAGEYYNPEHAALVMMDPNTGEVLAMAQYPSFNPNDPANTSLLTSQLLQEEFEGLTNEEQLNALYSVWGNRNITDTYEPGSIFKPVVVAAALEEEVISTTSTYYCGARIVVPGTSTEIPCWHKWGHGLQTLNEVVANSCNVGMIHIIQELGRDKFFKYRNDFGFGEKTGIDLPGEESSGSPAVMYTLNQLNPVELATSSMGQGFNNTPIQAINAFAAIINGGNLMKPYLVSQIIDPGGNIVKEFSPSIQKKVISKETSDYLRVAMIDVVSPSGTAKLGYLDGYAIGGKTGTGQQGVREENENVFSYIAYLPADDPEFIALALINKPENKDIESSVSVVPMLTEVLSKVIQYKGIQPTMTDSENADGSQKADIIMKDYRNLRIEEVTKELNRLGMDYEFIGNGSIVSSQLPVAGSAITANSYIFLYLTNGDEDEELFFIPNVTNQPLSQAMQILQNAGFLVVVEGDSYESSQPREGAETADEELPPEKTVAVQIPGVEAKVPRGTQIKLKLSD